MSCKKLRRNCKGEHVAREEKWGFILNPIAGNGFAKTFNSVVVEKIRQYNIDGAIFKTEHKGHATEISTNLANDGYTHIVAVGGDGTINEAARGILDREEITFGVVSAGTGNDFVQILGFTGHFTDADWKVFFQQNTVKMDVGKCNENYFLNGMGLGFDAQVAAENFVNEDGTTGNYLWHILKHLFSYKEKSIHLKTNKAELNDACFMTTIANGRRFAAGYYLTPKAIANDALLDICHVNPLNFFQRLNLFLKVPKGAHLNHPKVSYLQADNIKVHFSEKVPHHLDGELFFASDYEISILPARINIIYNPGGKHFFETGTD
jgi:diacylglycerol kinase (ATP)